MTQYIVSADIGTQGTKAAIVSEKGAVVASSFRPSRLIRGAGGRVEQDPEEMLVSVVESVREALEASGVPAGQVAAIGLDGQMAGILGIDREGNAVTPYDSWLDTRCESAMPQIRAWGEEAVIRITGAPVTYAHGPKKLWWKRERPDVYKRIAKFVVPSAYVAGRLAGLTADEAFVDYTHLHFSGFADVEAMRWSPELTGAFGLDPAKLPAIVRPWDIVGRLRADYAAAAGLAAGTPIVAGCGDTAAASFGGGLVRPGQLLDIAGTASVLACCVDRYNPDAETKTLLFARSVVPGLWAPLAYINGGGECLAWYRALVSPDEAAALPFDELNRMAEGVAPGSDGLLFVPHFGGSVCPNNADLRGAWLGLNWSHGKAAMYRSILESIAYEYRSYLDILERLAGEIPYRQVNAAGGGAKSALFNRIKADVLGIPVRTLRSVDSALTANAVIAGYGVGLFGDLAATAESFLAYGDVYEPEPGSRERYAAPARRYRQAVDALAALYGNLK
ncbi:hypothetical protein H7B90_20835 [Cohnella xylanilytica]|uniref:Xylulokinase n=1 Tax=Cohnella xylanilytica TaxID=557555 RepID=A0A841U3Y8_9BACL|nr:FGGY family carbohydrate kinase [Cohnella xylanilytica]MBB6693848.1 hypothetical protein [Cohnella xylanilytica]